MTESSERGGAIRPAYRAGAAVAIITSLLTVWATVVRDDGTGIGFFMVVMAAAVGGFSASFRAAGMARTMLGVAIMEALLGIAIATAPVTASVPGGSLKALLFGGFFTTLWLMSAILFRAATETGHEAAPAL